MTRKFITPALAIGVALALGGCGGGGSDDTVKFGIAGPITGSDAAFGAQLKQGTEQSILDLI
jgi:branched-chain amino acid transport system substrate-binding protein